MQELVDTHCHIQSIGALGGEAHTAQMWATSGLTSDQVIKNAVGHGVTRLICVGCDLEDSRLSIDFVQSRPECWATIGLHPHEAKEYFGQDKLLEDFASLATKPKVVAIGECGLDYYYEHSPRDLQKDVLEFQFRLAGSRNLPMIFHVREAYEDFWSIYDKYPAQRGVVHSFSDSRQNLDKALERGLYIGVNGIVTFTKSHDQLAVYRQIPSDKMVLETDAPFLTPHPFRGNINEPMRVETVADFLAELKDQPREEIARITTSNARQLFGI